MKTSRVVIGVIAAMLLTGGVVGYVFVANRASASLPSSVTESLTFSPLIVSSDTIYAMRDHKQVTAEDGTETLQFVITTGTDATVYVTESAQPPQFSEIPDYKEKWLENKQETTIPTAGGTIYLSRPVTDSTKQIGIMLERGLLIFLNPSEQLDTNTWREIGDSLELYRITTDN